MISRFIVLLIETAAWFVTIFDARWKLQRCLQSKSGVGPYRRNDNEGHDNAARAQAFSAARTLLASHPITYSQRRRLANGQTEQTSHVTLSSEVRPAGIVIWSPERDALVVVDEERRW